MITKQRHHVKERPNTVFIAAIFTKITIHKNQISMKKKISIVTAKLMSAGLRVLKVKDPLKIS